jgi:hypothetical protein
MTMDSISNDFSHLSVGDLHAPSQPSTTPALERISLERDVFTDDDHRPLDAKIVNAFSAFRKHNEEPSLSALLSLVTMDKRLTMLTTDEAEELLDREPSIARILRNGWQVGSFKEVRQLGMFAVPFLSSFELINITAAILWPEVQEQPKRSVVPIEQRASTCLRVLISLSHLSFPSLRRWYVEFNNRLHKISFTEPIA